MTSSTVPAASGGGGAITWTLLGTATPASTVSTYTFSGLSGYKQYRLVSKVGIASSDDVAIQVNATGGSIYAWNVRSLLSATWSTGLNNGGAEIRLNQTGATTQSTDFVIEDMSNSKSASWTNTSSRSDSGNAIVNLSSAITSLTYFTLGAANFSSGLIRVYGGN
jgi:hypothetical protein